MTLLRSTLSDMTLLRSTLVVMAIAPAIAGGACAQANPWVEIADNVTVAEFGQTVDAIDDWNVLGPGGNTIGEVEEVVGAQAGTATALTVDFDDRAGFGNRDDVVIPLSQFTFLDNRLTLTADAAAIGRMEVYND